MELQPEGPGNERHPGRRQPDPDELHRHQAVPEGQPRQQQLTDITLGLTREDSTFYTKDNNGLLLSMRTGAGKETEELHRQAQQPLPLARRWDVAPSGSRCLIDLSPR